MHASSGPSIPVHFRHILHYDTVSGTFCLARMAQAPYSDFPKPPLTNDTFVSQSVWIENSVLPRSNVGDATLPDPSSPSVSHYHTFLMTPHKGAVDGEVWQSELYNERHVSYSVWE